MTFAEWRQFTPDQAATEVHRRVRSLLPLAQQRAVIATLETETQLREAFERASPNAPLARVPYLLKDLFDVPGRPTFAGSNFLPEVRAPSPTPSAIVLALENAGAVFAGKTHLHEFAYGITGENPHYGDCEHPRFPGRTSGGSSSGSAAAVAAGIVPLAIGTDTGGSIRVPAAFCGVYGFRLSPETPLIQDAVPLAPTFDTAGWFTANLSDMRSVIEAIVGKSTPRADSIRGLFLDSPDIDADVQLACRDAALALGAVEDEVSHRELLEAFAPARETYQRFVAHEAWSYHAPWFDRYATRYDPNVRQRLEYARTLPRADYEQAHVSLAAIRLRWAKFFQIYDFLAMPATPFGALLKADCTPANRNRLLALNAPASLGGYPVLTIPVALPSGLTTGLQLIFHHPKNPALSWLLDKLTATMPTGLPSRA